jgi:branched-chain amino acid transport system substrate-binding protein
LLDYFLKRQEKIMYKRRLILHACWLFCAVPPVLPALAAEPIRIGMVAELTGVSAEIGASQVNGVRLALDEINQAGGVLGRPLEVDIEDNQSTNPGSVFALSKVLQKGTATAIITSVRSTQILAMMPLILKAGLPAMMGGTDYTLTHADNPWLFRMRPHDGYSVKAVADFGVNTLKRKKWAIIYSTEAFGVGGKNRLIDALKALDLTPVMVQALNNTTQDFAPAVTAIQQSHADIVAVYLANTFDIGKFAIQFRKVEPGVTLIGAPPLGTVTAIRAGGSALYDSYSINDFVADANPQAHAYAVKYREKYRVEPDLFSSWGYDAVYILALAIKNANSTHPEETRKAILAIRGFKGVEGTHNYDHFGDGLHGYNIVKNEQGKIVFIKHIAFQPE